jgi:hypothetical protein
MPYKTRYKTITTTEIIGLSSKYGDEYYTIVAFLDL